MNSDNQKPVFDVRKPGSVGAAQTGKPVITNNQPLQKDPMMTEKPKNIPLPEIKSTEPQVEKPPKVEDGTLHNLLTENHLFGEIKHKKINIVRTIFLGLGFLLTIAGIVYYFMIFVKK